MLTNRIVIFIILIMRVFLNTSVENKVYLVQPNQAINTIVDSPHIYSQGAILSSSSLFSQLQNNAIIAPITLILGGSQIFVRMLTGKNITLDMENFGEARVDDVKNMIFQKENIAIETQVLFFAGRRMESGHLLSEYDVQNEAVINLVVDTTTTETGDFQLAVMATATTKVMVTLPNGNNTTVDQAKKAIASKLSQNLSNMLLFCGGKPLTHGDATLKELGIKSEDMLTLIHKTE